MRRWTNLKKYRIHYTNRVFTFMLRKYVSKVVIGPYAEPALKRLPNELLKLVCELRNDYTLTEDGRNQLKVGFLFKNHSKKPKITARFNRRCQKNTTTPFSKQIFSARNTEIGGRLTNERETCRHWSLFVLCYFFFVFFFFFYILVGSTYGSKTRGGGDGQLASRRDD